MQSGLTRGFFSEEPATLSVPAVCLVLGRSILSSISVLDESLCVSVLCSSGLPRFARRVPRVFGVNFAHKALISSGASVDQQVLQSYTNKNRSIFSVDASSLLTLVQSVQVYD